MKQCMLRIDLQKIENYVIFTKEGDQAVTNKEKKTLIVGQEMKINEPRQPGSYTFQFSLALPAQLEAGTFYHSGKTLSAKIIYRINVKILEFTDKQT